MKHCKFCKHYNDCIKKLLTRYYQERKKWLTDILNKSMDQNEKQRYKEELKSVIKKITELR